MRRSGKVLPIPVQVSPFCNKGRPHDLGPRPANDRANRNTRQTRKLAPTASEVFVWNAKSPAHSCGRHTLRTSHRWLGLTPRQDHRSLSLVSLVPRPAEISTRPRALAQWQRVGVRVGLPSKRPANTVLLIRIAFSFGVPAWRQPGSVTSHAVRRVALGHDVVPLLSEMGKASCSSQNPGGTSLRRSERFGQTLDATRKGKTSWQT
jgi:hypothetical protein